MCHKRFAALAPRKFLLFPHSNGEFGTVFPLLTPAAAVGRRRPDEVLASSLRHSFKAESLVNYKCDRMAL